MKPTTERLSPDGKYKLITHSKTTSPSAWGVLEIEVRRTKDDSLIGMTTRNYSNDGILHFVTQDGTDYLVLSEDYHGGYGVMDLATGKKAVFDPSLESKDKREQFWCWVDPVSHDPQARTLTICGCYWAAPFDRITFDFSQPMSPPYKILDITDEPYNEDEWEDEEEED